MKQSFSSLCRRRHGSVVLYAICTALLALLLVILSLQRFKSGQVSQLNKGIGQEKMAAAAQAGVNELIAIARSQINNEASELGSTIKNIVAGGLKKASLNVSAASLDRSNAVAKKILGSSAAIKGKIDIQIAQEVGSLDKSYVGLIKFSAAVEGSAFKDKIEAYEERELQIANLASSFFDKYALYVKSFCPTLNDSKKTFIINGIKADPAKKRCSFVYLGNRNYPSCSEFKNGGGPVLLDVSLEDNFLLGGFYSAADFSNGFNSINSHYKNASKNRFFRLVEVPLTNYFSSYESLTGCHTIPELLKVYNDLIAIAQNYANSGSSSMANNIIRDYQNSGGSVTRSAVFREMVKDCLKCWKYHYGFTDYCTLDEILSVKPFSGLQEYFKYQQSQNPARCMGGKMPLLFGKDRKTCVFVEGNVYARFFKVAFIDDVQFPMQYGEFESEFFCSAIRCTYEIPKKTFMSAEKPLKYKFTPIIYSHPVDDKLGKVPINKFYFGKNQPQPQPHMLESGDGASVFPDVYLNSFSHLYSSPKDFLNECVDKNGVLHLNGFMAVEGDINLSKATTYKGKGYIVVLKGHCTLGTLKPTDEQKDILKIYLMNGSFNIASDAEIHASLAATAQKGPECTLKTNGNSVNIVGNLIVDALMPMNASTNITITHSPLLYSHPYPITSSIGQAKIKAEVNYSKG